MADSKIAVIINEFDKGRRTVISLEDVTVIISREVGSRGYDMIHINIDDVEIMKWVKQGESIMETPVQHKRKQSNQTAGQTPYAMFNSRGIWERFKSESCVGSIVAQKAALLDLSGFIEMNTGRLRKGWGYDSHNGDKSLTMGDIARIIDKKERQAKSIIGDLISNGILVKQKDGYYLNREFVLRGKELGE